MKRLLLALAGLAGAVAMSYGAPGVEADPSKDYAVTPEAGAWMICATCYVGPQAVQLAHEMVLEIRTRYHLPAYVMNKGEQEREEQRKKVEEIHKKYPDAKVPLRVTRIEDQCAVLVGGYKDMDAANRALKDVKKLPPPSSQKLMPVLAQARPVDQANKDTNMVLEGGYVNPFLNSFVVPNPTIPREQRAVENNKPDPFLKKLNAGERYSIFHCKKPWTLAIAAYQGLSVVAPASKDPSFWRKLFGESGGEMLEASGQNAHNLAEVLRTKGFEAYVFHTRRGSIVTVGGFDRSDDPRMGEVQRAITTGFKYGQGIQLLPEPLPMEVPKS
jgi:hypothetical protein